VETGLPEIMMFSINIAFDIYSSETDIFEIIGAMEKGNMGVESRILNPERAALYALCEQRNVGISVMKALGAGKLISAEHTPFSKPMTVAQCMHYALTRPAVIGAQSKEQMKDAVSYVDASDAEKDYAPFLGELRKDFSGQCVYCNHCLPCPSEIDIAAVNRYLDIAKLDKQNIPPSIRSHYNNLANKAGACTECGSCEARCPFGVEVRANMKSASEIFRAFSS
jgi:hypothetical protein